MASAAVIAHHSPGRTRFRLPEHRYDNQFLEHAASALRDCEGVESVSVSPATGSLLVLHVMDLDALLRYADEHGLFQAVPSAAIEAREAVLHSVAQRLASVDDRLLERSQGKYGVRGLAFYGLVGSMVYQLYRGNVLPAAETLLHHALGVLAKSQSAAASNKSS